MQKFTFVDLFAGIGGFHIGLRAAGGHCVYSNEWDKYAAQTYRSWTGHVPDQSDIRKVNVLEDIPAHDVLAGGFPCQPFSLAGVSKKISLGRLHGFQDLEQGNLFFAICDIVAVHRPKVVLLENVKNLKSHDKGKTWAVILESLSSLGYHVTAKVIDAKYWVPQHRERVFIVAFRDDLWSPEDARAFEFPSQSNYDKPSLDSVLEESPDKKFMLSEKLWIYLQNYSEKHKALGNGFGYSIAQGNSHARTLSARYHKDGSEILIDRDSWERPRRLTPLEARRLMGFTEEIARQAKTNQAYPQEVSDTQAYKQFGNSVCPLVVWELGARILKMMESKL